MPLTKSTDPITPGNDPSDALRSRVEAARERGSMRPARPDDWPGFKPRDQRNRQVPNQPGTGNESPSSRPDRRPSGLAPEVRGNLLPAAGAGQQSPGRSARPQRGSEERGGNARGAQRGNPSAGNPAAANAGGNGENEKKDK